MNAVSSVLTENDFKDGLFIRQFKDASINLNYIDKSNSSVIGYNDLLTLSNISIKFDQLTDLTIKNFYFKTPIEFTNCRQITLNHCLLDDFTLSFDKLDSKLNISFLSGVYTFKNYWLFKNSNVYFDDTVWASAEKDTININDLFKSQQCQNSSISIANAQTTIVENVFYDKESTANQPKYTIAFNCLNYTNCKFETSNTTIMNLNRLCDLFEGPLINHNHDNLLYFDSSLFSLLKPSEQPALDKENPDKISESFYDKPVNNSLLPVLMSIPIGGMFGYTQSRTSLNAEWLPKIPWGYYELTDKTQQIAVVSDDPKSVFYNYLLATQMARIQETNSYFILPVLEPLYFPKDKTFSNATTRTVYIIKYNNNVIFKD